MVMHDCAFCEIILYRINCKICSFISIFTVPFSGPDLCGWLFSSLGSPCVAHLVCAIPTCMSTSSLHLNSSWSEMNEWMHEQMNGWVNEWMKE